MIFLLRYRRYLLPILAVLAFSISLLIGFAELIHEGRQSRTKIQEMIFWSAAQTQVEYWRFVDTLDRHYAEPDSTPLDEVIERLDILWSRINIYGQGDVGQRLAIIEGASETIAALSDTLEAIEPGLAALKAGDQVAYEAIHARLAPFGVSLFEMAQRTNLHEQNRAIDFRTETTRTYWILGAFLIGILISGIALITLLLRELGNTRILLDKANEAETRSQSVASHLSAVLKTAVTSIITIDTSGIIRSFNPAAERLFGYKADEVISRNVSMLMPEPDQTNHDAYLTSYISGGYSKAIDRARETTGRTKDGHEFPMELSVGQTVVHDDVFFVGFIQDISERKQAEDRLIDAIESLPIGFALFDNADRLTLCNSLYESVVFQSFDSPPIGKTFQEIIETKMARGEIVVPEDQREKWLAKRLQAHRKATDPMELQFDNGHWYWINEKRTREQGIIVTYIDVTERKRAEEEFRHAQKMEAIGRFTGGVAHEFNNLLTAIGGFAHMVKRRADDPDIVREWSDDIISASDQAAVLTSHLLSFSRKQVLEPKIVSVDRILHETKKMILPIIGGDMDRTLKTTFQIAETEEIFVKVDPSQFSQALLNLAINARDAMPKGGNLTIANDITMLDSEAVVGFDEAQPGLYASISVTDTGTGIDEETQKKIFEPFFTTKEEGEGTGLGLAMVYGMVQQLGGVISVYSKLGVGTTFTIHLPLADTEEAKAGDEADDELASYKAQGETVLVAEDELKVRQLARIVLEGLGYTVLTAESGEKALEIYHDYGGNIDLLVTDIKMPGMNGQQLARKLKAEIPKLKLLFITAYNIELEDGEELKDAVLLRKPFDPNELGRIVSEMLSDSRNASAA